MEPRAPWRVTGLFLFAAAVSLVLGVTQCSRAVREDEIQAGSMIGAVSGIVWTSQRGLGNGRGFIGKRERSVPAWMETLGNSLWNVPLAFAANPNCPTLDMPNVATPNAAACNNNKITLHYPGVKEASDQGITAQAPYDPAVLVRTMVNVVGCQYPYNASPQAPAVWFNGDNILNFGGTATCNVDPLTNTSGVMSWTWSQTTVPGVGKFTLQTQNHGSYTPATLRVLNYNGNDFELEVIDDSSNTSGLFCRKQGGARIEFSQNGGRTNRIATISGFHVLLFDSGYNVTNDETVYTPDGQDAIPGDNWDPTNPTWAYKATSLNIVDNGDDTFTVSTVGDNPPIITDHSLGPYLSMATIDQSDPLVYNRTCCWPVSGTVRSVLRAVPKMCDTTTPITTNLKADGKTETITFGVDKDGNRTTDCGKFKWVSIADSHGDTTTETRQMRQCY